MSLPTGKKLGHYQIVASIGAGGMGEVYRAQDTKLGRDVALKVLPEAFARDEQRMARFTREAQLLASLNHVNIAAIYGVEESGYERALVLELIEGETLAERIARGAIPTVEALKIALQITEALEAAHEKGIVHRDLKPANVKITPDGLVKVLDFGLARAMEDGPAGSSPSMSQSPTLSVAATAAGIILGTAGYMSPEQARGKPVDRRADIWAFGVIVFEMLSGRRAYDGETVSDTIAKVLEREPDWNQLPPKTPLAVRQLIQHCLNKNLRDRLQAIGDARTQIQELLRSPAALDSAVTTASAEYPLWKRVLPWAVAVAMIPLVWFLKPAPKSATAVTRLQLSMPADATNLLHQDRHAVEISPDGKKLAFVAATLPSGPTPETSPIRILVRSIDQWDATPVAGTQLAYQPFFSPDGQSLGFLIGNATTLGLVTMKKVSLAGGQPIVLSEKAEKFGASWGGSGFIVTGSHASGLKKISETGGDPEALTQLDDGNKEASHRLPHFLPDGSGVLFTVLRYRTNTPDWKAAQVWIYSFKSGTRKLLLDDGVDARYVAPGYLVFARTGKLFVAPFDLKTLSLTGTPRPVGDGVTHSEYGPNTNSQTGAAQFSASADGTLVYAPGSIEPPNRYEMVWVDRNGKVTSLGAKPRYTNALRLSPDGQKVLFNEYYVDADLWSYDLARGTEVRETFEGQNAFGLWTPDGKQIVFRSSKAGPLGIYVKEMATSAVKQLTSGPFDTPADITPDGKTLLFVRATAIGGQADLGIFSVSLDPPGEPKPLLNSRFEESYPEVSPDGKWLAYTSDQSGRREVYVQTYPDPGPPVLVSTEGGSGPAWSVDGKELFYANGRVMMSVRFKVSGKDFLPDKPVKLFEGAFPNTLNTHGYDVARDGRFLMVQAPPLEKNLERLRQIYPSVLRIVLHWTDELSSASNAK